MKPPIILPRQQQCEAGGIAGSKLPSALTVCFNCHNLAENSGKLCLPAALLAGAISLLVLKIIVFFLNLKLIRKLCIKLVEVHQEHIQEESPSVQCRRKCRSLV